MVYNYLLASLTLPLAILEVPPPPPVQGQDREAEGEEESDNSSPLLYWAIGEKKMREEEGEAKEDVHISGM